MVSTLVEQYRAEKMPRRSDTRRSYEVWLSNYIIPKWGDRALSELQARPVELWIESLPLAPKSKVHIRGVLSILWGLRHVAWFCADRAKPHGTGHDQGSNEANAEAS